MGLEKGGLAVDTERGIVELLRTGGTVSGLGFLVDRRTLVTCAHVVNVALGRDARATAKPDDHELVVRFPFTPGAPQREARLVYWAPSEKEEFDRTDLAGLNLENEAPTGADPVTLGGASDFAGEPRVGMWGPVIGRNEGGHVTGTLLGLLPGGRRQINEEVVGTFRAAPGFSGGPVWLLHRARRVVGMLVAIAGREEARDVYVLDIGRLAALWPEQLRVEDDRRSLEVTWGPAGFGLPPGEFVYVLPGNATVVCALVVANGGSDPETVTRIEAEAQVVQRVPRPSGDDVIFGVPELRLTHQGNEEGLEWQQAADNRWIIDIRVPLPAGEQITLPVIGLATEDDFPEAARQYVAVPSLALDCEVTVYTEHQRLRARLSGTLRIFSALDEGGDSNVNALLGQLGLPEEAERESLRSSYQEILRYDQEVREQIAQAVNEGEVGRRLALADTAVAREPNNPEGHAERGRSLIAMNRFEDALKSFDKALDLGLDTADIHLNRGRALFGLERETEALSSFERSLELDPDVADTHVWRALALAGHNRDREVVAELKEALRLGFANTGALSMFDELLDGDAAVEFRHLLDRD
jgi:tetratricopeptide (TPR) repeat protein